jgi:hypothetical protein
MLTFFGGGRARFCDGVTRRDFLTIGGLALGGLTLSDLLAGGGMRTGQVIGSTTPDGGYADQRPVDYKDVTATLYHNLGIDVRNQPIPGPENRPVYLLEGHGPVEELI